MVNEALCRIRSIVYTTEEEFLTTQPALAAYPYREIGGAGCPNPVAPALRVGTLNTWVDSGLADEEISLGTPSETAPWGRINQIGSDLWVVTTTLDVDNNAQVTLLNVNPSAPTPVKNITGERDFTKVNFDPLWYKTKFNPIAWLDPETGSNMIAMRQQCPGTDPCSPGGPSATHSEIAIWREQTNGTWVFHTMFTPQNIGEESSKTAALSPEAFIWNNESYIVFSASDHVNAADQLDGNIWVARVPPQEAWLPDWSRQINERVGTKAVRRRAEGEVYEVTGGGGNPARPVIYYSMFEDRIDDLDNPCHYDPLTQQLEIMTLRRAEVCPPNVTTGVCSGQQ